MIEMIGDGRPQVKIFSAAQTDNEALVFSHLYDIRIIPGEGVYLLSERGHLLLRGELNEALVALVDGTRSSEQIVDSILDQGQFCPAEIYHRLHRLREAGLVQPASSQQEQAMSAFWQAMDLNPVMADTRIASSSVAVLSCGHLSIDTAQSALEAASLNVIDDQKSACLTVVVAHDYMCDKLAEINDRALEERRPWLLTKPAGTVIWIGPVFRPGQSACWQCLATRLHINRDIEQYVWGRDGRPPTPREHPKSGASERLAADFTVLMAQRWLAADKLAALPYQDLMTLDIVTMTLEHHTVVRRPQCTACGELPANREVARPITLTSVYKKFTSDGGHRAATPNETVKRYRHHISRYIGAVRKLERENTIDHLVHIYTAGPNPALRVQNVARLRQGLRTHSVGKGASDSQAEVSAMCEALERYSGIFHGEEPRRRATLRSLGSQAIPPNSCMLFSDRQYAERDEWNARGLRFGIVPLPFNDRAEIDWTPLWSLSRRECRYLPSSYLYYSYPHDPATFFCWADSNGNAAGNTIEEAILQGFFELVERDCVAQWWYNRVQRPAVDIDSFDDCYITAVRMKYEELARPIWVLDVTNDLRIPTFVAVSRRVDKPVEDIILAFGAHLDPVIALRRAITELNQFLPAVYTITSDGAGNYDFPDEESQQWWRTATTANQPYLLPDPESSPRQRMQYVTGWSNDLRDDVLTCQSIVEEYGMEFLVLEQTRPDINLPVVKVVVPGMRHFWARYAPGRLYDVPVKLGWLDQPRDETQLNPIPLFL